ncbi:uncharacterized protein E0L32_007651 [Thyridium curvatum]|uniref:EDC4-like protein pdc1 beta-propeller domain-containing protein n=1 Tax=Thyridium curvatum TaxID=1093900 RepID=A0A507AP38_9PEZI|nr:uncharacterized protein E0L32_007651 [Thyridium curvatum]TPX11672.1 hypothetical protein E0L32_007651 [Thyridium curvatum]
MSGNFSMSGGLDHDELESNAGLQSLLAQLRRTSNQEAGGSTHAQNLLSQFNSYTQPPQNPQFGQQAGFDSSRMGDSFNDAMASHLPAAPTPPVGGAFPNAQFPPNMPGSMASGRPDSDRTNSSHLLNLLKFSGSNAQSAAGPPSSGHHEPVHRESNLRHSSLPPNLIHAPAPAPSDPSGLLAALMQGSLKEEAPKPEPPAAQQPSWASTSNSSETQQYLLNLLNRPKPSQNDATFSTESTKSVRMTPGSSSDHANENTASYKSLEEALASSPQVPAQAPSVPTSTFDFESPKPKAQEQPASRSTMFDYSNPFDDLAAASPLRRTPKGSTTPGGSAAQATPSQATMPIQILKKPGSIRGAQDEKPSSRDASPSVRSDNIRIVDVSPADRGVSDKASAAGDIKSPETVAEAVSSLAEKADQEAQDALALAEEESAQAEIAKDLDDMLNAKTEDEFEAASQVAAQAIQKELAKEKNHDALDTAFPPDVAKSVKEIVDEAANGHVADSWESAEADEIVVIEETAAPVKVFNFPMKPWISITVQEDANEVRPVLRDETIIDIARLKKEFDQIDRNLVTSTESYITYGMSKAGGLRVIRQSDGTDAKLFTDTKDRIFNVAMSSSAPDQSVVQRDAILGTGISGTVYWVQIRDGDKDHIEDAHPEQYGFALPPISSQEGDAPGGVLKTRARISTIHPEYFAVGRGKSINIVWPGFILQNNLFKAGHDRVVDTDRLAKQCALKINTGKAGKDFTFSQDDTVVVSLDKSGRVKFWDVRDLTAVKEDSDPRAPLPAQNFLEVKEPLMTLTTTPEGEKAWPTSVLLLDKLRPYQKRGALRYMIVGMKQNHTLQLWDLALGKPVQEFNLPHSKESDAVCSVMYHPPTGMIVVGHPTRNSIYFLHLSAPKYSIKNLSQVEYVQKLNAQDSSIPQPESTAVISGLREYSFANKGALRSLDILAHPDASDENEQPLFELYAMHSKGVTCIPIRQAELGWTRDNKVMSPVDAVEAGIVKIVKLKSPPQQPQQVAEPHPQVESAPVQIPRVVARGGKDILQSTSSQDDQPSRKLDSASPSKVKQEPKTEEATAPQPSEKPEKKSRKKKAAAAAQAAAAAAQAEREASNQTSPKLGPSKGKGPDSSKSTNIAASLSQDTIDAHIASMESRLVDRLTATVNHAFENTKKFSDDQVRKRDVDFEHKQRKLLDLVSDVLNNNTQLVLGKIVREEFENNVLPSIREDVARSISDNLVNKINTHISQVVQRETQKSTQTSVNNALRNQDLAKSISEKVIPSVSSHVEKQVSRILEDDIVPAFTTLTSQTVQRVGQDIHRKLGDQIAQLEQIQQAQNSRIDHLTSLVTSMTQTVSAMAAAQTKYQTELLNFQAQSSVQGHSRQQRSQHISPQQQQQLISPPQQPMHHRGHDSGSYHSPGVRHVQQQQQAVASPSELSHETAVVATRRDDQGLSDVDRAAVDIDNMMKSEDYDGAMMRWLQSSGKEQELFRRVLVKYNPELFVQYLQPLVLLTVGTTVSNDLQGDLLHQRLAWTEMILITFLQTLPRLVSSPSPRSEMTRFGVLIISPIQDEQVRELTPKILSHIKARLEQVFIEISTISANDPVLKNIAQMASLINRIVDGAQATQQQPMRPQY